MEVATIIVLYRTKELKFLSDVVDNNAINIIIDNTPNQNLKIDLPHCYYIPLLKNKGIAYAQNIGIQKAIELGCDYVVFFDQDSIVSFDLIASIVSEFKRLKSIHPNLFALGPTPINGRTKDVYKGININTTDNALTVKREIISSGCCIQLSDITKVGMLDDSLFIDYVDHEWCWRAISKGYICGVSNKIEMTHYIGQNEKRILFFNIILSSPFRYYYQTRNWLWLLRRPYVPMRWKITTSIKKIVYPFFYPFITKSWKEIYKSIFKGFIDGLKPDK